MPTPVTPDQVPETRRGRAARHKWRDYVNAGWLKFTPTEDFDGPAKRFQNNVYVNASRLTERTGTKHHANTRITEDGDVMVRIYTEPVQ